MVEVQVLGLRCPQCDRLHANAIVAGRTAGVPCTVRKIANILQVVEFDPPTLPALAINGRVLSSGRVLAVAKIVELIHTACREPVGETVCGCNGV